MNIEKIKGRIFRYQNDLLVRIATLGYVSKNQTPISFIGNSYSGYWFPDEYAHSGGTVWGVGLGMDSSFELQLGINGYKVIGFEPDERCMNQAKIEFRDINSEIHAFGLWDKDGFFESFGTSISLINIFDNAIGNGDSLQVRDIQKIAISLKLDEQKSPRILKMNIEGAEREVLRSLLLKTLNFEIIMFQAEFLLHLGFRKIIKKIRAAIELRLILRGLSKQGYCLVHNFRNQFTLLSKDLL